MAMLSTRHVFRKSSICVDHSTLTLNILFAGVAFELERMRGVLSRRL
jgi:hypothetical protein